MMNAWDNLPNAKHIDRVLASLQLTPDKWRGRGHVWNQPHHTHLKDREHSRSNERNAVWNATINACGQFMPVTWDVLRALIAYDDCAYLLDMPADQVKVLALLGMPAAILLYPACVAFEMEIKTI